MIPSTGRKELARAVNSVRLQDYAGRIEIIVVFDLDEAATSPEMLALAGAADIKIFTGGGRKGGAARNLGVRRSSGRWVAFLDDDDEWKPNKVSLQLLAAAREKSMGNTPIIGCRVEQVVMKDANASVISGVPARLVSKGESIEQYLFVNRRPGARRASFFTSTVLAERWLCEAVPWDESLARHQDWDWLIRASRQCSASFSQVERDLVVIHVGSAGSISASPAWEGSLTWASEVLAPAGSRIFVDFLVAQTLRYALQKRDWGGVRTVLDSIFHARTIPGIGPLVIGAAGLMPRTSLQNLMRRIK